MHFGTECYHLLLSRKFIWEQSTSDFAKADELEDGQYCEAGQSCGHDTQNTIDEVFNFNF